MFCNYAFQMQNCKHKLDLRANHRMLPCHTAQLAGRFSSPIYLFKKLSRMSQHFAENRLFDGWRFRLAANNK